MRRPRSGLAIGLGAVGLSTLAYPGLIAWARRALVADAPLEELESALDGWLAEARLVASHRYFHTPVGRVHALLAGGGGRTLVVLPGLQASAGDMARLLAQLARDYRVVAIDRPGCGLSDPLRSPSQPWSTWDQVISAVTGELSLDGFDLVGHSLGGLAAGRFAVAHPDQVGQLVLISPLGLGRRIPLSWNLALVPGVMDLMALRERRDLVRQVPGPSLAEGMGKRSSAAAPSPWELYRSAVGLRFGAHSDLSSVGRVFRPLGLPPESRLLPALGLLSGRVLVLWGSDDRRLPLSSAKAELDYYPGLRLDVIEGAGHLLPFDQPQMTAQLVATWMKSADF